MTLEAVKDALDCALAGTTHISPDAKVRSVSAGDLMSDVLVLEDDHLLLITNLTTDQVVRTADIVDAVGVLLAGGKTPGDDMVTLAQELGIPILCCQKSLYEACVAVHARMREATP